MTLLQAHIGVAITLFMGVCGIMFFGTIGIMTHLNYKMKEEANRPLSTSELFNNFGKAVGLSIIVSIFFFVIAIIYFSVFFEDNP